MTNEADITHRARTTGAFTLIDAAGVMLGRPIPHVQEDEQVLHPFTGRNAVFMVKGDRARKTVVSLEETGLDGTRISFLRLDSASLSADEDATPSSQIISADSERNTERVVITGALIGGVVGAVVVGLLLLAISGGTAALLGLIGGFALGAALGALWAAFSRLGASDAWERSLHVDPEGYAVIGVHTATEDDLGRVKNVLEPRRVWVFGQDGAVLHRP